jgi:polyphenol oxidase
MQTSSSESLWGPFPGMSGVRGGFSLRSDGCMSFKRDKLEKVLANRRTYFERVGLRLENGIAPELVHGNLVVCVSQKDAGRGMLDAENKISDADGLVTNDPNIFLVTTHADCAPVYHFDPHKKVVGLAHAGWRGIVAGICGNVCRMMQREYGSEANSIHVAIGPTISQTHYDVSTDVSEQFVVKFGSEVVRKIGGQTCLNLPLAIVNDLTSAGVLPQHIQATPPCTFGNVQYSSYRREGEAFAPMLAWIGLL